MKVSIEVTRDCLANLLVVVQLLMQATAVLVFDHALLLVKVIPELVNVELEILGMVKIVFVVHIII
jgi:hypothetical protein